MLYKDEQSLSHKRREAGRKGGLAKVAKGYSFNKELASQSGKVGGKWSPLTEAKVDSIFALRNKGATIVETSARTGVSYGTVQKLFRLWKETGV